jgi:hypothetical protein
MDFKPVESRTRSQRPGPVFSKRRYRQSGASRAILLGCRLALALAGIVGGSTAAVASAGDHPEAASGVAQDSVTGLASTPHPRTKTYLKRQWGIEVLFVRQASAGYMLEFRYKVLDADRAKPLFDRQTKPVLTHLESGAQLIVPTPAKTGALRNSNPPIEGRTYWMFFANPGKLVKSGEHVSVAIGDFVVQNLVVR